MPIRTISSCDVVVEIRHYATCIVERGASCGAGAVKTVTLFIDSGEQAQRSVNTSVAIETGVGM